MYDTDCANGVILPFGTGAIITSGEADTTLTFAGQVIGEKTYDLFGGNSFNWIGNATPIALKLKDFAIPTDQSFGGADSIVLEIWGTDGNSQGEFSFVDENSCNDFGLTIPGWYPIQKIKDWDVSDVDCVNEKVEIPSGQMVIITSGEADTTLTLPDPIK